MPTIHEKLIEYYKKQITIKRLFKYPEIPLKDENTNYIHLTLVKDDIHQAKIQELYESDYEEALNKYPVPLGDKNGIVFDIIDLLSLSYKHYKQKILVLGPAGIGKSTLSKCILHVWAENRSDEKIQSYDWVVHLNLANITEENYPSASNLTVLDILAKEIISLDKKNFSLDENNSIVQVKENLQRAERLGTLLLVIDGMDELPDQLPSYLVKYLKELFQWRKIILLSRPYNLYALENKYDYVADQTLQIEGFNGNDVKEYIDKFFKYLKKPKPEVGDKLWAFLKDNLSIMEGCRTPINAELVCSTWEREPTIDSVFSRSKLYMRIINSMSRRYLEKYNRDSDTGDLDFSAVQDACKVPLAFLEYFAYQSLRQKKLFLNLDATRQYIAEIENDHSIENAKNLNKQQKKFGFIKPKDSAGYADAMSPYHFNHLLFRDFFAAKYIAYCIQKQITTNKSYITTFSHTWKNEDNITLEKFVSQNKFDTSFENVWEFVAGILAEADDVKSLQYFFSMLLDKPDEPLGIYTTIILMSCLNEAQKIVFKFPTHIQKELFGSITAWLEISFRSFNIKNLWNKLKLSPWVFKTAPIQEVFISNIEKGNDNVLEKVMDCLASINQINQQIITVFLKRFLLIKDKNKLDAILNSIKTLVYFNSDIIEWIGNVWNENPNSHIAFLLFYLLLNTAEDKFLEKQYAKNLEKFLKLSEFNDEQRCMLLRGLQLVLSHRKNKFIGSRNEKHWVEKIINVLIEEVIQGIKCNEFYDLVLKCLKYFFTQHLISGNENYKIHRILANVVISVFNKDNKFHAMNLSIIEFSADLIKSFPFHIVLYALWEARSHMDRFINDTLKECTFSNLEIVTRMLKIKLIHSFILDFTIEEKVLIKSIKNIVQFFIGLLDDKNIHSDLYDSVISALLSIFTQHEINYLHKKELDEMELISTFYPKFYSSIQDTIYVKIDWEMPEVCSTQINILVNNLKKKNQSLLIRKEILRFFENIVMGAIARTIGIHSLLCKNIVDTLINIKDDIQENSELRITIAIFMKKAFLNMPAECAGIRKSSSAQGYISAKKNFNGDYLFQRVYISFDIKSIKQKMQQDVFNTLNYENKKQFFSNCNTVFYESAQPLLQAGDAISLQICFISLDALWQRYDIIDDYHLLRSYIPTLYEGILLLLEKLLTNKLKIENFESLFYSYFINNLWLLKKLLDSDRKLVDRQHAERLQSICQLAFSQLIQFIKNSQIDFLLRYDVIRELEKIYFTKSEMSPFFKILYDLKHFHESLNDLLNDSEEIIRKTAAYILIAYHPEKASIANHVLEKAISVICLNYSTNESNFNDLSKEMENKITKHKLIQRSVSGEKFSLEDILLANKKIAQWTPFYKSRIVNPHHIDFSLRFVNINLPSIMELDAIVLKNFLEAASSSSILEAAFKTQYSTTKFHLLEIFLHRAIETNKPFYVLNNTLYFYAKKNNTSMHIPFEPKIFIQQLHQTIFQKTNIQPSGARQSFIREELRKAPFNQFMINNNSIQNLSQDFSGVPIKDTFSLIEKNQSYSHLNLSSTQLDESNFSKVVNLLAKHKKLVELDLSNNSIGSEDCIEPLISLLDSQPLLEELNLSDNFMTTNSFLRLVESVAKHPAIAQIDMSNNFIYLNETTLKNAYQKMSQALNLRKLNISQNFIYGLSASDLENYPLLISQPNQVESLLSKGNVLKKQKYISKDQSLVILMAKKSLFNDKNTIDDHALLAIESMNEIGQCKIETFELFADSKTGMGHIYSRNCSPYQFISNEERIHNYKGRAWQIASQNLVLLRDALAEDIKKGSFLPYSKSGSDYFGRYNCITWAIKRLNLVPGIEFSTPRFIAIPSYVVVEEEENEKAETEEKPSRCLMM